MYAPNYKAAKYEKESTNAEMSVFLLSTTDRPARKKKISKSIYEQNSRGFPGSSVSQESVLLHETQV